jgi:SAM-dependent methyltransferase
MEVTKPIHVQLVSEMEGNLQRHGDTFQGVGWTKSQENTDTRYQVMLDLLPRATPCTVLDFGCGAAHFYEFLLRRGMDHIQYSGLDLSPKYIELCRSKHPQLSFYGDDILQPATALPVHDYVIMNGLFNYKSDFSFDAMWAYCQKLLLGAAPLARKALAFNAMSKYVEWERDDLFHLPFDLVSRFVHANLSPRFTLRHDYGLYEFTVYVFKDGHAPEENLR